jgi:hypothetical protein
MGYRAVYFLGLDTFLTAMLSVLWTIPVRRIYVIPLFSQIAAITAGILTGAIIGAALALNELRSLTEKGEYRIALSTILFVIATGLIMLGICSYFLTVSPLETDAIMRLLWPIIPATAAARTILYVRWEKKYRRSILYASLISSRLYVFPKTEQPAQ